MCSEVHFCFSLPCVSWSGQYVFDVMDTYGGGLGVLWVAIFETVVIMWIYGVGKFAEDLCFMLNLKVSLQFIIIYILKSLRKVHNPIVFLSSHSNTTFQSMNNTNLNQQSELCF